MDGSSLADAWFIPPMAAPKLRFFSTRGNVLPDGLNLFLGDYKPKIEDFQYNKEKGRIIDGPDRKTSPLPFKGFRTNGTGTVLKKPTGQSNGKFARSAPWKSQCRAKFQNVKRIYHELYMTNNIFEGLRPTTNSKRGKTNETTKGQSNGGARIRSLTSSYV